MRRLTDQELLQQYKNFSDVLGRPATFEDMYKNLNIAFHPQTLTNRFGSLENVRKILGIEIEKEKVYDREYIENILIQEYKKHGRKLDYYELKLVDGLPPYRKVLKTLEKKYDSSVGICEKKY